MDSLFLFTSTTCRGDTELLRKCMLYFIVNQVYTELIQIIVKCNQCYNEQTNAKNKKILNGGIEYRTNITKSVTWSRLFVQSEHLHRDNIIWSIQRRSIGNFMC